MALSSDTALPALLGRLRAGDPEAARELVEAYEPHLRRMIRLRIRDSRLRRLFDSADICQSVMANFLTVTDFGGVDVGIHPGTPTPTGSVANCRGSGAG
jgi:hypothetical protein